MSEDVAIIGMAGRFPDARNINELYDNLRLGKDSVRQISRERIESTTLPPGNYMIAGFLENVDRFDYNLFGFSLGEAQTMSPAQRLLLEVAYETFENAGYNVDYFSGSRTAVFVTAHSSSYHYLADEITPTLITGNFQSFLAARLAREFNLMGNAAVVDTACSAALVALHMAYNEIILEDADYALVCGINLNLIPTREEALSLGVASPDGKSRAFSAQASGMSNGELVACVLLKPLEKAIADNDIIHAIIKGCAVNNNAHRSSSLTAPDSVMQAEVIKRAWQKAGVNPVDVGFIEAHGSGTQLGDTLEVEGLNLAFQAFTSQKRLCPISTIKSNIGHGILAAGMAGLIKTILSVKHKVLFPAIHCHQLNPLINFENSAVYIDGQLREWQVAPGKTRIAGVTSLGLSGTNCHVVLQEAPGQPTIERRSPNNDRPFLICVSSHTAGGLKDNLRELLTWIANGAIPDLRDLSYTLLIGRKHYRHRFAVVVDSMERLQAEVQHYVNSEITTPSALSPPKMILILSDHQYLPDNIWNFFLTQYPIFKENYENFRAAARANIADRGRDLVFQISFHKLLHDHGVVAKNILCLGIGKLVKAVLAGEKDLEEVIPLIGAAAFQPIEELDGRVETLIERETEHESVAFLDLGPPGFLSTAINQQEVKHHPFRVIGLNGSTDRSNPFLEFLKGLYLLNYDFEWKQLARQIDGHRIELPAYQFEKTRCWIREEPKRQKIDAKKITDAEATAHPEAEVVRLDGFNNLERKIANVWTEVLEVDIFSPQDDFFEMGGDSLKATKVINRIREEFNLELNFEDIFDFPTLQSLASHLSSVLGTEQKIAAIWNQILKVNRVLNARDDFFELGGHSLLATQVINRIKQEFRVELNFEEMFKYPTLEKLANYVDELLDKKKSTLHFEDVPLLEKKEYYPASLAQRRMYILNQAFDIGTTYNASIILKIEGRLDRLCFENTFKALMKRHETLRTSLHKHQGEIVQRIHDDLDFEIEFYDRDGSDFDDERILQTIKGFIRPFELEKAPLFRVGLIKVSDDGYVLMFDIDHIIIDRASVNVITHDFAVLYNGYALPDLRIQYKEFACWQNSLLKSEALTRQEQYWLDVLSGELPTLELPVDFARSAAMNFEGGAHYTTLSKELTRKLKRVAYEQDVTLYMLLLAGWFIVLSRLTGQRDIMIGAPVSTRNHVDLEKLIGVFLNTIVFRAFPKPEKAFPKFLREVKDTVVKANQNQHYPFEMLLEKLKVKREPGRNPLFDISFNAQTTYNSDQEHSLSVGDLKFTPYHLGDNSAAFDIEIAIHDSETNVHLICSYRSSLFKGSTIAYFVQQYQSLLEQIAADSLKSLQEYEIFKLAAFQPERKKLNQKIEMEGFEKW